MSRTWISGKPDPGSTTIPPLPSVTFKGVQIATPPANAQSPTVAQLLDANVGCVRPIAHWGRTPLELRTYLKPISDAGIFVILNIAQDTNAPNGMFGADRPGVVGGELGWIRRVTEMVEGTADAVGAYELINEPGRTFRYNGTLGANWNQFFLACEDAATIIKGPPFNHRVILGAAENQDTNALLAAAHTRYGDKYNDPARALYWAKFYTHGAAIHAYSSSASAILTKLNTSNARAPTRLGDNGPTGDLVANMPMWITECGLGAGGNVGSGLVGAAPANTTTTSRSTQALPTGGTAFTLLTNALPAAFPASGQAFFRSHFVGTGPSNTDLRKINYTGKAGNSLTGCQVWDCGPGEEIVGGEEIQIQLPDGNAARENAQAAFVTNYYNTIFPRAAKTDLHIRNIGYFIWRDYVGHGAPSPGNPGGPINWAEYCGLCSWLDNDSADPAQDSGNFAADNTNLAADTVVPPARRRPSYDNFKNANGGNPTQPLP